MKKATMLIIGVFIAFNIRAQNSLEDTLAIGEPIPVFLSLNNASIIGNAKVGLNDYNHLMGVIIVFMTNQCYHCIFYRDRIKNLHKMYAKKGYPIIAINPYNNTYATEDTFAEMQKNAAKEKYEFPYLQTDDEKLPGSYTLRSTPTVYIAQKKGLQFLLRFKGIIDDDMENKKTTKTKYVENFMNTLLAHKTKNKTKS